MVWNMKGLRDPVAKIKKLKNQNSVSFYLDCRHYMKDICMKLGMQEWRIFANEGYVCIKGWRIYIWIWSLVMKGWRIYVRDKRMKG